MSIWNTLKSYLLHTSDKKLPDISVCDCLVGVVKDMNQLNINLRGNFYHVPAKYIYELDMPVKYVALYTSARTFGAENAGICRYGRIKSFRTVPRYQIKELPKNSPEIYFVFEVDSWQSLEHPVRPLETAQILTVTSFELLKHSEYMPELYLHSWEEIRFFEFLKQICLKNADKKRYNFNGTKIGVTGDTIEIIYRSGYRQKLARSIFTGRPFALYKKVKMNENKQS